MAHRNQTAERWRQITPTVPPQEQLGLYLEDPSRFSENRLSEARARHRGSKRNISISLSQSVLTFSSNGTVFHRSLANTGSSLFVFATYAYGAQVSRVCFAMGTVARPSQVSRSAAFSARAGLTSHSHYHQNRSCRLHMQHPPVWRSTGHNFEVGNHHRRIYQWYCGTSQTLPLTVETTAIPSVGFGLDGNLAGKGTVTSHDCRTD